MSKSKFLIGFHAVTARLRYDAKSIDEIYFEANRYDRRMQDFLKVTEAAGVRFIPADVDRLRGIAGTGRHQGVVAKAESLSLALNPDGPPDSIEGTPLLPVFDGVTDPHNPDVCLCVAGVASAHAVIASKDRSVGINTTVVKVVSGVAETVPYITVTNLAYTLCESWECGVWVIGTVSEVEQDPYQAGFKGPTAIAMGAEDEGMCRLACKTCDALVSIPVAGSVESPNVLVAGGVCLFEAVRQRAVAPVKK